MLYGNPTANLTVGIAQHCAPADISPKQQEQGRVWCVYRHDPNDGSKIAAEQKPGFPKHYLSMADAKEGIRLMHVFSHRHTGTPPVTVRVARG